MRANTKFVIVATIGYLASTINANSFEDGSLSMLHELGRFTFHRTIEGSSLNWLVTVCHSGHWECRAYFDYSFKENLMFPLSEEENLHIGYVDTADYPEIEAPLKADVMMPRLVLFTDYGKQFYVYEGDVNDLD